MEVGVHYRIDRARRTVNIWVITMTLIINRPQSRDGVSLLRNSGYVKHSRRKPFSYDRNRKWTRYLFLLCISWDDEVQLVALSSQYILSKWLESGKSLEVMRERMERVMAR